MFPALLFSGVFVAATHYLYKRVCRNSDKLDPVEAWGLTLLVLLGVAGWCFFMAPLLTGNMRSGPAAFLLLFGTGTAILIKRSRANAQAQPETREPRRLLLLVGLGLALIIPTINALAPPDGMEWDSLAYHLAVPKLWVEAGQITYVPFIHHSNFPFMVDSLYLFGEDRGSEAAAKIVSVLYLAAGLLAIFGLTRRRFGPNAATWSALAFAAVPVVLWQSGTAYIDVAHGLYAGLGLLYAIECLLAPGRPAWLPAALLGFACASKYTGLQTLTIVMLLLGLAWLLTRSRHLLKTASVIGVIAAAFACPWYIRNFINTGNPVYPFFYEKLGGKNWDQWRADIYRDEQQSFGVGRTQAGRDPLQLPHAALGLAYQPGRYINPAQTVGQGLPMGAVGVVPIVAALGWLLGGKKDSFVRWALGGVGLSLILWFFLSQQSRYIVTLAVPLCFLAGGAATKLSFGRVVAGIITVQAAYSAWLIGTKQTLSQLPVVFGQVSRYEYLEARVPFFGMAQRINQMPAVTGVALYDEVFGYFLDKKYFWANPGHGTMIRYEQMQRGADLARALENLGLSHVYFNLQYQDSKKREKLLSAMGLAQGAAFSDSEKQAMFQDLNLKWHWLLADAVASGEMRLVEAVGMGLLFELKPG